MDNQPLFDEENILHASGSLQESRYGRSWKLGIIHLTDRRLFFTQGTGQPFQVDLEKIQEVETVKRGWLLGVRIRLLCVSFRSGRIERTAYIGVKKPDWWMEEIKRRMTLILAGNQWREYATYQGP